MLRYKGQIYQNYGKFADFDGAALLELCAQEWRDPLEPVQDLPRGRPKVRRCAGAGVYMNTPAAGFYKQVSYKP